VTRRDQFRSLQPLTLNVQQAVAAEAEEFQAAEVAEHLELLADFVVDVGVLGMERGKRGGVGVDIRHLPQHFLIAGARASAYRKAMNYSGIITMEPGKRGGKPCIRGLRVTVYDVLENLAGGMTHEELLGEFPYLTEEDIRACLAFAADRERKLELLKA